MKDDFVFPRTGVGAPGMELRDLFAVHIASGVLARDGFPNSPAPLAMMAYSLADVMLKIRALSVEQYDEVLTAELIGDEND